MAYDENVQTGTKRWHRHWIFRYGVALLLTAVTLDLRLAVGVFQHATFSLFITAVVVCARYLGFGPALFTTGLSVLTIDYVLFPPPYAWTLDYHSLERLAVFLGVCIVTASMARQRSRAETMIDEIRESMAAIVESSADAIFSTTPGGVITSWNRGAEALYGFSSAEVIGRHVALIAPPERAHEITLNTERLNRGEAITSYQTERMRKDGSRINILLSISPLRNRKGEIVGSSAIARDITAQRQAEQALRRNEKLATAGRLAATIAHEINNPLEAVMNLLYLARHDSKHANDYLTMAEKELERLATIARQTLGFVRDASSPAPLDVARTLDEVLGLYRPKLDAKQIVLRKQFPEDSQISGYAGELRQLFSNLIVNAVDAMGEGGCLALRVARAQDWAEQSRSGIRVTIADNGAGITPKQLEHIFEPFYTTKKGIGTGLGLWLCHGIVQKHGGSIYVRSRTHPARCGTVFSVFLPYQSKPAEVAQPTLP